jgi:hypothetical protein
MSTNGRIEELEAQVAKLTEALQPFAKFVFGAGWYGHTIIERSGDVNVLCGYDAEGNTTGTDVNYSDFVRARAAVGGL